MNVWKDGLVDREWGRVKVNSGGRRFLIGNGRYDGIEASLGRNIWNRGIVYVLILLMKLNEFENVAKTTY